MELLSSGDDTVLLSSGRWGTRKNVHMAGTHRQWDYANGQPGLLGASGHEVRKGPVPRLLHTQRLERLVLFSKAAFSPGGGKGEPYGPSRAGRPQNR